MRDLSRQARIPRRLGPRFQRPQNNQYRSNAIAVFNVSIRGAALDRSARRADPTHDFPGRSRTRGLVSSMLSGFAGPLALKRSENISLMDLRCPHSRNRTNCFRHRKAFRRQVPLSLSVNTVICVVPRLADRKPSGAGKIDRLWGAPTPRPRSRRAYEPFQ